MTNRLIVGLAAGSLLFTHPAFALGAYRNPPTPEQQAQIEAQQKKEEEEAAYHRSRLVAIVDGYKVWSIWDEIRGDHLYVTTPCGNTQWKSIEGNAKVFRTIHHEMPSVECKP